MARRHQPEHHEHHYEIDPTPPAHRRWPGRGGGVFVFRARWWGRKNGGLQLPGLNRGRRGPNVIDGGRDAPPDASTYRLFRGVLIAVLVVGAVSIAVGLTGH